MNFSGAAELSSPAVRAASGGRRSHPSAASILFLPGWLASAAWWEGQVEALSARLGWQVLAADYPAYCGAGGRQEHSVEAYAALFHELVEMQPEPVAIVGWSLGAGLALRIAERFGTSRIRAMVLVDQTPRSLPSADWRSGVRGLTEDGIAQIRHRIAERFGLVAETAIAASLSRPLPHWSFERLRREALRWDPVAAADLIQDHWRQDYRGGLSRLSVPTLIVGGARSAFTPRPALDCLHASIRGSELVILQESGHAPFLDEPSRFTPAVADFLRRRA
jgi:pimeloyl-[acyl-carrier protein] methyl ester esterase